MEGVPILRKFIIWKLLFFAMVLFRSFELNSGEKKHRYAVLDECDRFSLDAVYNEKFKLITNNIFADSKEFVSQVAEKLVDCLINMMTEIPDRDFSNEDERKFHAQFDALKKNFATRVKKLHRNITSSWEKLIASHFDLMYDFGNVTLEDYLKKMTNMTDAYAEARKKMDSYMGAFVQFAEVTVRDGLTGITIAAENALKKEEEERKKNETSDNEWDTKKEEKEENKEDTLRKKKEEIAAMIVPGFLGKITQEVIKRNMDLFKTSGIKPEDRDNVFDDLYFDIMMIKNRISAIIQPDQLIDKGAIDLARRSIYTYWADLAEKMYKEKISSKKTTGDNGRLYYRKLWNDEEQLAETLLDLMDLYP